MIVPYGTPVAASFMIHTVFAYLIATSPSASAIVLFYPNLVDKDHDDLDPSDETIALMCKRWSRIEGDDHRLKRLFMSIDAGSRYWIDIHGMIETPKEHKDALMKLSRAIRFSPQIPNATKGAKKGLIDLTGFPAEGHGIPKIPDHYLIDENWLKGNLKKTGA